MRVQPFGARQSEADIIFFTDVGTKNLPAQLSNIIGHVMVEGVNRPILKKLGGRWSLTVVIDHYVLANIIIYSGPRAPSVQQYTNVP